MNLFAMPSESRQGKPLRLAKIMADAADVQQNKYSPLKIGGVPEGGGGMTAVTAVS